MEDFREEVMRIISETENLAFIASVYSFIKGLLSAGKGGAA